MNCRTLVCGAAFLIGMLSSASLLAQTVCDIGNQPLNPAQPSGITPAEIIQKFAAQETTFKIARARYGYTLDVTIQTLTVAGRIDGEYHQVSEIALGANGAPVEKVTFAPQSTLRRIGLTPDDLDDIHQRLPFAFGTEELPLFSITYAGRQHVDMLDTYVFDVSPKNATNAKSEKKLFAGRLWVDDQDLMVVKTCGKLRRDENATKRGAAELTPLFVTYREEVDGQFWFTTYAQADEFLPFPRGTVHMREVVRYSNYKPFVPK
jgi:hypothetical protein